MTDQLSKPTSIFGLHLWAVLGICLGAAIVLLLFLISLWFTSKRSNKTKTKLNNDSSTNSNKNKEPAIPVVSKDIPEVRIPPDPYPEPDPNYGVERQALLPPLEEESPNGYHNKIQVGIGKDHRICYPAGNGSGGAVGSHHQAPVAAAVVPEVSHLGWGHWYTLRELEVSTSGFAPENVVGEGGYGIVYYGVLEDRTQIAVKNLLNNRYLIVHCYKI